jgi:hypothetical protein
VSVKGIIDRVMPRLGSEWNRSGTKKSVLKLVEQAQDEIIKFTPDRRIWRGTDNHGLPPFLLTTEGQEQYSINGTTLSSGAPQITIGGRVYPVQLDYVRRIWIDHTHLGYYAEWLFTDDPFFYLNIDHPFLGKRKLYGIQVTVDSQPSLEKTDPTVNFFHNPKTTTREFFIECTYKAPRLLSESIPLIVPEDTEIYIEDFCVGRAQESDGGNPSGLTTKFYNFCEKRFQQKQQTGTKPKSSKTPIRYC